MAIVLLISLSMFILKVLCYDQFAQVGEQNVQLSFEYSWNSNDVRKVECYRVGTLIGQCSFVCSIERISVGVFTMSSTPDVTTVYVYIITFNDSTSGTYACSKANSQLMTTINIQTAMPLTSLEMHPPTNPTYPVYNEQSTYTCLTSQTRPAPNIMWFIDNRTITESVNYTYSSERATSFLKYIPTAYTSESVSCVSTYVYKTTNITLHQTRLSQIQYSVSKPAVSMNNSNLSGTVTLREGRQVEWTCSSSGYPSPTYRWIYLNETVNGAVLYRQYTRSSNGLNVSCEASNMFYFLNGTTSSKSSKSYTSLILNVLYPPATVRFSVHQPHNIELTDSNIRAVKGDNFSILCESDANPRATVFWNGQQTNTSIMTVTNIQEDTAWTCYAFNIIEETTQGTATDKLFATVLYAPAVPTISFGIPDQPSIGNVTTGDIITVIEGSSLQLVCSANSRPASIFSWGSGHKGNILSIFNITKTTYRNYTCLAHNTMDITLKETIPGMNYSSIYLRVLYGPDNLTAIYNTTTTIDRDLRVMEGWSFNIACFSSSVPAAVISWHGPGTHQDYVLFINDVTISMSKVLTCTARNYMTDDLGEQKTKSATLTINIDVLYPPVVQITKKLQVLIHTTLTVLCNLSRDGNPPATDFYWMKVGTNTSISAEQSLVFENVSLTNEGEYRCYSTNIMQPIGRKAEYGTSQSQFFLDVQYSASIGRLKGNGYQSTITVDQGEPIEFVCDTDGDPVPVVRIINATSGSETLLIEKEAQTATSYIHRARCEYDAGHYKCLANNSLNKEPQEQILAVSVNCSPRASPFSPPIKQQYSVPNDSVVFTFTIKAFPAPKTSDFTWYKHEDGEWKVLSDERNILINISDSKMQTQLTILRVHVDDYAEYMVNVSNTVGSISESFTLHARSRPHVPKELHVSQIGKTELVVEWVPGFNGGDEQNFTIRYKEVDVENSRDIDIASSKGFNWTIEGLKPNTAYQLKMLAQNTIGKSDWTEEITETTLADAVENDSASSAIGGAIGGAAGVGIIIAVTVGIWRYRTQALKTTDSKPTLSRRSINHENGTYENIGMVTPHQEKKTTTHAMARPGNDLQIACEHSHRLAPHSSQNNIHISDKHAVKSVPHPDTVQSSTKTVEADILGPPITPSKEKSSLQRRDSFAVEHDPIYDNLYKKQKQFKSRDISVQNLRDTVVRDKDNKTDVFTEYSALNIASEKIAYSTNAAMRTANTSKNRYKNMYPYDKNRVTLSVVGNELESDFINASFIDGYSYQKKYIAAQGPLSGTIADLWRMIWEQNVRVVVMVTNLVEESKRKCFQYWPTDSENDCQYGDSTIHLLSEETYSDFVIRRLQCTQTGSSRTQTVTNLHFTSWPDKDVPDTALSLMQFWRKVRNVEKPDVVPWIVHCSAGVGRTGTFIALDYLYDQGVAEKQINVFDAVLLLREQRINMIQTKNQYLYLHEVLCEALCPAGEVLANKAYLETKPTADSLNQEYKTICQSYIPDREEAETDGDYIKVLDGEKPENMNKNIDPCVVPDDKYRPVLSMAVNSKGHTDYINAVYISTFREADRLILTQSARTSSDIDFVRLLHDHYVRTVVTLGDQVEPYMPENGERIVIGPFTASAVSNTNKKHSCVSVVKFKHIVEHESFEVRIFRFTHWSKQFDVCQTDEILSMIMEVQESASSEGPIVIQCRDGYSRSGLVAVLWCLMERSKRDGEVALGETVRVIRRRREQVIKNEAQYRFCHEFMKEYVEGCLVYANT